MNLAFEPLAVLGFFAFFLGAVLVGGFNISGACAQAPVVIKKPDKAAAQKSLVFIERFFPIY